MGEVLQSIRERMVKFYASDDNAITLNGEIINDENYIIDNDRKYNIIRRGKKKYYIFEK